MHEGGYSVDAEGRFYYPWGGEIAVPVATRGDSEKLIHANGHLTIDDGTCEPGLGQRLDLGPAIDDLLAIDRRAARSRAGPIAA